MEDKVIMKEKCKSCQQSGLMRAPYSKFYCCKCYEYYKIERHYFLQPSINQICEKVFLGDFSAAKDKDLLNKLQITHILTCAAFIPPYFPDQFKYLILELDDSPHEDITQYFETVFDFIQKADKVLIHCVKGVSRSAAIAIAYLMWKNKLTYDEALNYAKIKRNCIYPNHGFENMLKKYKFDYL